MGTQDDGPLGKNKLKMDCIYNLGIKKINEFLLCTVLTNYIKRCIQLISIVQQSAADNQNIKQV